MEYRALGLADRAAWAGLLAASFDRTQQQMEALLEWFHEGFPLVTWGAWDGDRLVAQYNARLLRLHVPGLEAPVLAGMGLNMTVDAEYRGRGLLESVARPVHEMLTERGCVAGVGFSSAGGLAVTRRSSSYAYDVLGPMVSTVVLLSRRRYPEAIPLGDRWPSGPMVLPVADDGFVRYSATAESIHHRFAEHPFRRYAFAASLEEDRIRGLVVYRPTRLRGIPAAALLAAYGDDLATLLGSWAAALRQTGVRVIHVVTSPASPLRHAVGQLGMRFTVPFSREPYHLIARGLQGDTPRVLFDLDRWDCAGGDIL